MPAGSLTSAAALGHAAQLNACVSCAAVTTAKAAADKVPTPAAPAPPSDVLEAAKAVQDAVPKPSTVMDAAKDGEPCFCTGG